MLALLAAAVLAPLLYIPGFLIARALLGAAQPNDMLERHFERVVLGALLNGWLALTLAELGVFSAPLHLVLLLVACAIAAAVAWRRRALGLPTAPIGIISQGGASFAQRLGQKAEDERPKVQKTNDQAPRRRLLVSGLWSLVSGLWSHWQTIGFVAVGLLFAILVARPFEVVLGARDAGVYATTGFAIARHGGIVQDDALVRQIALDKQAEDPGLRAAAAQAETNLLGTQPASRFIATRLRYAGYLILAGDLERGQVVPQFFHLYPAWIGLLASMLGLRGGLLATSLLGLLGVWSVGMLGRRLAGPWVGLLGALFLALNGVQVWFSRYSTSEACAQFLGFAALYGFAVMQEPGARSQESGVRGQGIGVMSDGIAGTGPSSAMLQAPSPKARAWFGGLIAGLAAGQLALTRIDFFVIVAPIVLYLVYSWLARRWTRAHTALTAGMGAMLLHAALHVTVISRAYFFDTLYARLQDKSAIVARVSMLFLTPELQKTFLEVPRSVLRNPLRLPIEVALLVFAMAVLWLLRRDGRLVRWFERAALRLRRGLLWVSAVAILALGAYGYLVRPQILTVRTIAALPGCLLPGQLRAPSAECLALQGYIGAPVAVPAHPNALAYALDVAPKLGRAPALPAPAAEMLADQDIALRETPSGGGTVEVARTRERVQLIGKDSDGYAYLVRDGQGAVGWALTPTLALDTAVAAALSEQPNDVVDKIINPRTATTFSFANPGESAKIGIAQANLVRVGWYLSPLGVILGIVGFALLWLRRMSGGSWLFLVASLASTILFVRLAYGTSDVTYIYILRRYLPLAYPAFSLGMAYAIVALAGLRIKRPNRQSTKRASLLSSSPAFGLSSSVFGLFSAIVAMALIGFFAATNRPLYRHVEYAGALDQLAAAAERFQPGDVLLFRGLGRDTPDLVTTPLKYAFDLDTFAIRSVDPGKYAVQLADYVRRWQAQGRNVYLVLGPNGAAPLPGLRPVAVGPMSLRLPEFQQLRDQKPSGVLEFAFNFTVYRLDPDTAVPPSPRVAVNDYTAQVRGFYGTERIDGAAVAWTDGDAVLRVPVPPTGQSSLAIELAPGTTRPAALGSAHACVSYLPERSFALSGAPFLGEQCFDLGAGMQRYRIPIDSRNIPAHGTGTLLLRITSAAWVPAVADPAQHDQRRLGVQFGGAQW
jgi:hypothetical protein